MTIGQNRVSAGERAVIGIPLTAVASTALVIVMIPALLYAALDIVRVAITNGEPYGRIEALHRFWDWTEHNGHRLLYGEHNSWQWTP
jgi:hypothetical protein